MDKGNYDTSLREYRQSIRPYSGCRQRVDCSCNVCRMQPPTLQHLALQFISNLINTDRFELTANKTHRRYLQAIVANLARLVNLPPDFPSIWVRFRFDIFSTNSNETVSPKGHGM